jgi:hypothetical protein
MNDVLESPQREREALLAAHGGEKALQRHIVSVAGQPLQAVVEELVAAAGEFRRLVEGGEDGAAAAVMRLNPVLMGLVQTAELRVMQSLEEQPPSSICFTTWWGLSSSFSYFLDKKSEKKSFLKNLKFFL